MDIYFFPQTPYITGVYPQVGPISGGTEILIFGGFFGSSNTSWEVSFGVIGFQIIFINDTLIGVVSPNVTSSQNGIIYQDLPLNVESMERDYRIKIDEAKDTFTYKPDPIIEKIEPLTTFLR